jgi:hypothetical protein
MNNDNPPTAAAPLPLTLKQRIARRLFPVRHCTYPVLEGGHQDTFRTEVTVKLSWADRLRLFASGWLCVKTRSVTAGKIGANSTNGTFHVLPPDYLEPKF